MADLESRQFPRFDELLALADHLILSGHFACQVTAVKKPAAAAAKLWRTGRSAVVVTCGAEGCWFLDGANKNPEHFSAFRVKATDTTGCGDVFHGAYAAALARELPLLERLRLALHRCSQGHEAWRTIRHSKPFRSREILASSEPCARLSSVSLSSSSSAVPAEALMTSLTDEADNALA